MSKQEEENNEEKCTQYWTVRSSCSLCRWYQGAATEENEAEYVKRGFKRKKRLISRYFDSLWSRFCNWSCRRSGDHGRRLQTSTRSPKSTSNSYLESPDITLAVTYSDSGHLPGHSLPIKSLAGNKSSQASDGAIIHLQMLLLQTLTRKYTTLIIPIYNARVERFFLCLFQTRKKSEALSEKSTLKFHVYCTLFLTDGGKWNHRCSCWCFLCLRYIEHR